MKKIFYSIGFILSISNIVAQDIPNNAPPMPHIEVVGKSEKLVEPNEIYVNITLTEKEDQKEKMTVAEQEARMKKAFYDAKLPLENLTLSDANSQYVEIKRKKNAVITTKQYNLKLQNANEVTRVYEILDDLKINSAYISHVSHSDIEIIRKEVRIMAIKAAKDKAQYLVSAIGYSLDKPILITETEGDFSIMRNQVFYEENAFVEAATEENNEYQEPTLSFEKIKVTSSILVHFGIK